MKETLFFKKKRKHNKYGIFYVKIGHVIIKQNLLKIETYRFS